ncbi:hypothetical protein TWF730_003685 [Orbilia blumenaviensis]|uniref:Uncharacterized protein n=1 Tax=Orbilia blumenaviensis TaxID=1796055 RepID=A0AAV9U3R3_9PEZI
MGRGTRKTPKKTKNLSKSPQRNIQAEGDGSSGGESSGRGEVENLALRERDGRLDRSSFIESREDITPQVGSSGEGRDWGTMTAQQHETEYSDGEDYEPANVSGDTWSINEFIRNTAQDIRGFVEGSIREVKQYLPSPDDSRDLEGYDVEEVEGLSYVKERNGRERIVKEGPGDLQVKSGKKSRKSKMAQQQQKSGLRMAGGSGTGGKSGDGSVRGDSRKLIWGAGGSSLIEASGSTVPDDGSFAGSIPARQNVGGSFARGDRVSFRPGSSSGAGRAIPVPKLELPFVAPDDTSIGAKRPGSMSGTDDRKSSGGGSSGPPTGKKMGYVEWRRKLDSMRITDDGKSTASAKETKRSAVVNPKNTDPGPRVPDGGGLKVPAGSAKASGGSTSKSKPPPSTGGSKAPPGVGETFVDGVDGPQYGIIRRRVWDYSKMSVGKRKKGQRRRLPSPGRNVMRPHTPDARGRPTRMHTARPARPWQRGIAIIGENLPRFMTLEILRRPPGLNPAPPPPPRPATPAIFLTAPDGAATFELSNPREPGYLVPPETRGGNLVRVRRPKPPPGGPPMIPPAGGGGGGGPPGGDGDLEPVFTTDACPENSGAMIIAVLLGVIFIAAFMFGGRKKEEKFRAAKESRLSKLLKSNPATKFLTGLPASFTNSGSAIGAKLGNIGRFLTTVHDAVPMSERVGHKAPRTIGSSLQIEGDSSQTSDVSSSPAYVNHRAEVLKQLGLPKSGTWKDVNKQISGGKLLKTSSRGKTFVGEETCNMSKNGKSGATILPSSKDKSTASDRATSATTKYIDRFEGESLQKAMVRTKPDKWSRKDWQMFTRIPTDISWCPATDIRECLPPGKNNEFTIMNTLAEVEHTLDYFRSVIKKQKEFFDKQKGKQTTVTSESQSIVMPTTSGSILPSLAASLPASIPGTSLAFDWLSDLFWGVLETIRKVPLKFGTFLDHQLKGVAWWDRIVLQSESLLNHLHQLYIDLRFNILHNILPEQGRIDELTVLAMSLATQVLNYWFPPLESYFGSKFSGSHASIQALTILRAVIWYQLSTAQLLVALMWPGTVMLRMVHLILKFSSSSYRKSYDIHRRLQNTSLGTDARILYAMREWAYRIFAWTDLMALEPTGIPPLGNEPAGISFWGILGGGSGPPTGFLMWIGRRIRDIVKGTLLWWTSIPRFILDAWYIVVSRDFGRLSLWCGAMRVWQDFIKPPVMVVVWAVWIAKATPVAVAFCFVKIMVYIWNSILWLFRRPATSQGGATSAGSGPPGPPGPGPGPLGPPGLPKTTQASGPPPELPRTPAPPKTPPNKEGYPKLSPGNTGFMTPGGTRNPVPYTIDKKLLQSERKLEKTLIVKLKYEEFLRRLRVNATEARSSIDVLEKELLSPFITVERTTEAEEEIQRLQNMRDDLKVFIARTAKRLNEAKATYNRTTDNYNLDQKIFNEAVTRLKMYRKANFRGDSEFRDLGPADASLVIERNMIAMGLPTGKPSISTVAVAARETAVISPTFVNPDFDQISGVGETVAYDIDETSKVNIAPETVTTPTITEEKINDSSIYDQPSPSIAQDKRAWLRNVLGRGPSPAKANLPSKLDNTDQVDLTKTITEAKISVSQPEAGIIEELNEPATPVNIVKDPVTPVHAVKDPVTPVPIVKTQHPGGVGQEPVASTAPGHTVSVDREGKKLTVPATVQQGKAKAPVVTTGSLHPVQDAIKSQTSGASSAGLSVALGQSGVPNSKPDINKSTTADTGAPSVTTLKKLPVVPKDSVENVPPKFTAAGTQSSAIDVAGGNKPLAVTGQPVPPGSISPSQDTKVNRPVSQVIPTPGTQPLGITEGRPKASVRGPTPRTASPHHHSGFVPSAAPQAPKDFKPSPGKDERPQQPPKGPIETTLGASAVKHDAVTRVRGTATGVSGAATDMPAATASTLDATIKPGVGTGKPGTATGAAAGTQGAPTVHPPASTPQPPPSSSKIIKSPTSGALVTPVPTIEGLGTTPKPGAPAKGFSGRLPAWPPTAQPQQSYVPAGSASKDTKPSTALPSTSQASLLPSQLSPPSQVLTSPTPAKPAPRTPTTPTLTGPSAAGTPQTPQPSNTPKIVIPDSPEKTHKMAPPPGIPSYSQPSASKKNVEQLPVPTGSKRYIRPPTKEDLLPSEADTPMRKNVFKNDLVKEYYKRENERLDREEAEERERREAEEIEKNRREVMARMGETEEDIRDREELAAAFYGARNARLKQEQEEKRMREQGDGVPK